MLKWLISIVRRTWVGFIKMATFWTSIGVMLFPVGLAILIQWTEYSFFAFLVMTLGIILGIIGYIRSAKEENARHAETVKNLNLMTLMIQQLKKDDEKRTSEHDNYMYLLSQIGKQFGVDIRKTNAHFKIKEIRKNYQNRIEEVREENEQTE